MAQSDIALNVTAAFDLNQLDQAAMNAGRRMQGVLGSYTTNFKQFQQSIDAATSRVTALSSPLLIWRRGWLISM